MHWKWTDDWKLRWFSLKLEPDYLGPVIEKILHLMCIFFLIIVIIFNVNILNTPNLSNRNLCFSSTFKVMDTPNEEYFNKKKKWERRKKAHEDFVIILMCSKLWFFPSIPKSIEVHSLYRTHNAYVGIFYIFMRAIRSTNNDEYYLWDI